MSTPSGFAAANRPTEPQDAAAMASYVRGRRSKGEPFLRTVSDWHFLLFLCNMLDMKTEMPVLCNAIVEGKGDELLQQQPPPPPQKRPQQKGKAAQKKRHKKTTSTAAGAAAAVAAAASSSSSNTKK